MIMDCCLKNIKKRIKLIKIIKIKDDLKFDDISDILIKELKPYKDGTIMTSNNGMGLGLIDNLKNKGFKNIIELNIDDTRRVAMNNIELLDDKNKLYELVDDSCSNLLVEDIVELSKELDNIELKQNINGVMFQRKSEDIGNTRIVALLQLLSKIKELDKDNIDFKGEILKERQIINKAVEEYNSVILDNIDNIEKLFKSYHEPVRISYDSEGYIILEIILKDKDREYRHGFRYIRNSGYENIIKDTENKLKRFITRIAIAENIEA